MNENAWQNINEMPNSLVDALFPDGTIDTVYAEIWDNVICYYHACNDEYCEPQPIGWREAKKRKVRKKLEIATS